jgi:hypothetical protein
MAGIHQFYGPKNLIYFNLFHLSCATSDIIFKLVETGEYVVEIDLMEIKGQLSCRSLLVNC